ncbi:MAG: hypothetical protein HEP71_06130 [Roseivirga sp.]|nr:hypothetical protein [Roseivirga sp.]
MRILIPILCALWLAGDKANAQEKRIKHKYDLILTLEYDDNSSLDGPFSLLLTPDKKHLILGNYFGKSFELHELKTGKLIHKFKFKDRFSLNHYFFENNETLYIGDGEKKLVKLDLAIGGFDIYECTEPNTGVCFMLENVEGTPAMIWDGKSLTDINYPGRYVIKYTPGKIYMYYNMDIH